MPDVRRETQPFESNDQQIGGIKLPGTDSSPRAMRILMVVSVPRLSESGQHEPCYVATPVRALGPGVLARMAKNIEKKGRLYRHGDPQKISPDHERHRERRSAEHPAHRCQQNDREQEQNHAPALEEAEKGIRDRVSGESIVIDFVFVPEPGRIGPPDTFARAVDVASRVRMRVMMSMQRYETNRAEVAGQCAEQRQCAVDRPLRAKTPMRKKSVVADDLSEYVRRERQTEEAPEPGSRVGPRRRQRDEVDDCQIGGVRREDAAGSVMLGFECRDRGSHLDLLPSAAPLAPVDSVRFRRIACSNAAPVAKQHSNENASPIRL